MRCFPILRPIIHHIPPEYAHALGLWVVRNRLIARARIHPDARLRQQVWGMDFSHPVGLAAGFDKNADALAGLCAQGFSFVEAGTITPRPQEGNPKPRLFRLVRDRAVINRLGFNNQGLDHATANLSVRPPTGIIGANLGKNKDADDAAHDYLTGLERVYPYVDYITINISSPNTQGLRTLQKREQLTQLLTRLMERRKALADSTQRTVPLLIKIAPDLDESDMQDVAEVSLTQRVDGVIISNTTIKRPRTLVSGLHGQQGGLSGAPLFSLSTEMLARFYRLTDGKIPLIGTGGISTAQEAYQKIRAGASLVQIYTALIYQGFGVVRTIVDGLPALIERDGFSSLQEAVGADHR